jgi:hypothetical protein
MRRHAVRLSVITPSQQLSITVITGNASHDPSVQRIQTFYLGINADDFDERRRKVRGEV